MGLPYSHHVHAIYDPYLHQKSGMQAEWTREAESVVEERRSPEVANLPTSSRQDHLFAWSQGGPQAGRHTMLAYNRAAGPLRQAAPPYPLSKSLL